MITVNSNKGIIKIRKKMLILTLALSTSLTGCSLSRQPKELNIKKINYKLDDVNKTSSKSLPVSILQSYIAIISFKSSKLLFFKLSILYD